MTEKSARLSIYLPEALRTKFKMACTAKQTSMNQVLLDFIEEWSAIHDPFAQQPSPTAVKEVKQVNQLQKGGGRKVKDE